MTAISWISTFNHHSIKRFISVFNLLFFSKLSMHLHLSDLSLMQIVVLLLHLCDSHILVSKNFLSRCIHWSHKLHPTIILGDNRFELLLTVFLFILIRTVDLYLLHSKSSPFMYASMMCMMISIRYYCLISYTLGTHLSGRWLSLGEINI